MALSAPLHAFLFSASSLRQYTLCTIALKGKQNRLPSFADGKRKDHSTWVITSVLRNRKPTISSNNGAIEPANILLDSLFDQALKLEEQIGRDSSLPQVIELGFNLGQLESDLQAALEALKKKEEDLQDKERKVLQEHSDLTQVKAEFEKREEKILAACSKQEKLEDELRQANLKLGSQAREIEDLKRQLKKRDKEISDMESVLCFKVAEINKMKFELMKKTEDATCIEAEIRSKAFLLSEANEVVRRQQIEVQELQEAIQEKEEEVEVSMKLRRVEEDKLIVAEANLEKQTIDWLLVQSELKRLAEEVSKHTGEASEAMSDFQRVKKLLSDVRIELVSSQKLLASSRQRMEEQEHLLEMQLIKLDEQKRILLLYLTNLKDAQTEINSERIKHRIVEARNKELEQDLSTERELVDNLQRELNIERTSLQQAVQQKSLFQEELNRRSNALAKAQSLLCMKKSELAEARLEIQHLKSAQASFFLILQDKEMELLAAGKMLEKVIQEIAELRVLMGSKEEKLIQATTLLKEKDEHVRTMQNELNDTKQKVHEAESVVKQIVEFTDQLVSSVKDEGYNILSPSSYIDGNASHQVLKKPADEFGWQNTQLEIRHKAATESLNTKEKEILVVQRALAIKDEELKMVQERLIEKEEELKQAKKELSQDTSDLRKLGMLTPEKIESSTGDLVIEKLQLEAAQLQVEAATVGPHKLTETSCELISKSSLTITADLNSPIFNENTALNERFHEVRAEVARLSDLAEQLVKEAGIVAELRLQKVA